jgi:hypothetical protein
MKSNRQYIKQEQEMRISTMTVFGALALLSTAACTINPPSVVSPTPVVVQAAPAPQPTATVIVPRTY